MKNNILEGEQFSAHLKKAESVWSQYKFEHEKNCYLFGSIVHKHFDRAGNTTRILACSCVFYFKMLLFDWQIGAFVTF